MKKSIFLISILSLFAFCGCGDSNSLEGTKWSKYTPEIVVSANWIYPAYYTFVEFTSASEVIMYDGSENGSPSGTIHSGKYSIIDNAVTFTSLSSNLSWLVTNWKTATISGNTLTMHGIEDVGDGISTDEVFRKVN